MPMPYQPGDLPKTASGWMSAYAYRIRRTDRICPPVAMIIVAILSHSTASRTGTAVL